jgi:hydrogenase-4 component E
MIPLFTGLFLVSLMTAFFTAQVHRLFLWYAINSFALGALALAIGWKEGDVALLISGGITMLIKVLIIPAVLMHIARKIELKTYLTPKIGVQHNILLVPAILVFTFYLVNPLVASLGENANAIAVAISALFLALLLMVEHDHIAAKVVGFLTLENALFLLGTTATEGMPMIVELGIFFDLLMAIVVINLLFRDEVKV